MLDAPVTFLEAPTLQPTELVNEAWLRLTGNGSQQWKNRAHFFGAAAEAMRRILVERARRRNRLKRGGQWERVELEEADIPSPMPDDNLLALDEALERLAAITPEGMRAQIDLSLTDDDPQAQAIVIISALPKT